MLTINTKLRELRREGRNEEIFKLCEESKISRQQAEKFISGKLLFVSEEPEKPISNPTVEMPADLGDEIIYPIYKDIHEKLEQEQEELLKNVKSEKEKAFIKTQLSELIKHILADAELSQTAFFPWKSLARAYKYMSSKAKAYAIDGVACISDGEVFGWMEDYYHADDKEAVETEMRKAAKQTAALAKKTSEKKPAEKKARKPRASKTKEVKEVVEDAEKKSPVNENIITDDISSIPELEGEQESFNLSMFTEGGVQ